MTGRVLLALLTGGGVGLGLWLIVAGWRGHPMPTVPRRLRHLDPQQRRRWVAGIVVGLLVLALTRWVAVAVGLTVLTGLFEPVFGGARRAQAATDQLEALAGWTESLRDLVASGIALPEALPASVQAAAPSLRPHLMLMTERLASHDSLEQALRALATDLDDGGADLIVAALLLNSRAQGRALHAVLSALAASSREQLRVRRTIDAERRSTRRGVQIVMTVTIVTALGLAVGSPTYVAPYRSSQGQVVLALIVAVFATAFTWLARLSAIPSPPRLLETTPVTGSARSSVVAGQGRS